MNGLQDVDDLQPFVFGQLIGLVSFCFSYRLRFLEILHNFEHLLSQLKLFTLDDHNSSLSHYIFDLPFYPLFKLSSIHKFKQKNIKQTTSQSNLKFCLVNSYPLNSSMIEDGNTLYFLIAEHQLVFSDHVSEFDLFGIAV